ncbi:EAL domain-containing protein [Enterobacter sp. CC120223-11]|uniref:EAL domain-containing protein n=1 Tax=Enterobacter sp. CC120223-11 TaxID=1378073 RepID=UPI000BC636D9|nr:EAL domain-containing protein [Enterobacter sp. CC120223-11]SNY71033.1 EAL domain, c-di-GMP-specific phosphodiesterase class I (or its enzymatically inactive variant) [Enterobacter sp. CC120223-11]
MHLTEFYKNNRDKWWGLPLILPLVLLPVARSADTFARIDGGIVSLYYLPLAFLLTMMLFFGWEALPGIALGIWFIIAHDMSMPERIVIVFHFLIPIILSWGGYRVFVPRRHAIAYDCTRLMPQRLFWQVFFPATLFQLLLLACVFFNILPARISLAGAGPMTLHSLINYQSMLMGCLTGVPLCYLAIRTIRNPLYLRSFYSRLRLQIDAKASKTEIAFWLLILLVITGLLFIPDANAASIFTTNYTLSLLLPVMLWGAMRFGYRLMSIVWTLVLIVTIHFYYRYLPLYPSYSNQLAITSSSYLVFSFIVMYMAMLATQQRRIHARVKRMAYIDPVVQMPNLWALSRKLSATPWSVLCFLRIPELEVLGRHYGMMVRIQYKQNLGKWVESALLEGESIYQLSGHDLVIRLNTDAHETRIAAIDTLIKKFRFIWDGMPLQPNVGVSYCHVRSPVQQLPMLLGELSTIANASLITGSPENLQHRNTVHLQQRLKDKVTMMNRLQLALEHDGFCLMAQPIVGSRGDNYHEVLLRMQGENDQLIFPDDFLPVAHEFGLSSRIDLWVLEHTLIFMDSCRETLPGLRLSINISSASACGSQFAKTVAGLLLRYNIQGWQLVFEITETQSLNHPEQAMQNMEQLQTLGCRIAIDDFGAGYASYARLKKVSADILKIDGGFIQNLLSSSLDYQIVSSICQLARMKNMQVVAEFVESEEVHQAVMALGIDYVQGFYIGRPEPLEGLAAAGSEPQPSGRDIW